MNERDIFTAALEIADPGERDRFLAEMCSDADSKARILALLQAEAGLGRFLETPVVSPRPPGRDELPGTMIGPYKLMELIGEGGMGLVFVAEQQAPVRRKVALKIIKPGMDSRDVIARFEAERQALALMDHPNIAKVFDAGMTAHGRPFFVMELVKGITITEYCDQHQLTARERLELFLHVCRAVQHAHSKGIIHRDLKPSNILVAPHDGVPVVKVIDFGVAKAIGQQLTDKTIYTRFTQMIGTPLYMSPEQAEINALDIDTRSDVYSLGVLLYELLTGTTPFDMKRFATAAYDEIRRIIREEEPPKPSTRLSTMGESLSKVSGRRKTEPAQLSALVKGDLDWIVMKALEKDRNRRYDSASAFAADVRRFLAVEPIEARPPSAVYRFRKLARRNKVALITATLVAAALLLGTVASTWQALRATSAEKRARSSATIARQRKTEADEARSQAEKRRDQLATLNENLRRAGYIADMNLARHAWDENNLVRANELLEKHRPVPGETDLRGFEWHYLHRLFHRSLVAAKGHGGGVVTVGFSADGKSLLSCGPANTPTGMVYGDTPCGVKRWDAETLRELRLRPDLPNHKSGRMALIIDGLELLTMSPDGSHLAEVSSDHAIRVRDIATDKHVSLEVPKGGFETSLAFSPDSKRLVGLFGPWDRGPSSGSDSFTLRVWDVATGNALVTLDRLPLGAGEGRLSPDGQRVVVYFYYRREIRVWDVATGREAFACKYDDGNVFHAIFSPDGHRLVACGENGIQIWDIATQRHLSTWRSDSGAGLGLVFSPDGKRLAMRSIEGLVELWDVGTGRKVDTFKGHFGIVATMAFSPDGRRLATGGADGMLRVWDTTGHDDNIASPPADSTVGDVDLSPDGEILLTRSRSDLTKSPQLWDVATGARRGGPIETRNAVIKSHWTSDGKGLFMAELGNTVSVIDVITGKAVRAFPVAAEGRYVTTLSPDGKWFAHSAPGGKVKVLDARTGVEFRSLDGLDGEVHHLAFGPDASRLLGTDEGGVLKIWDVATGRQLATTKLGGFYLFCVRFSPDGRRVALMGNLTQFMTGEVRVLDAEDGREILLLRGHTLNVLDGAFTPDGRRLATASVDRTVRIWDLATGQEVLKLSGFASIVASVRFVSEGTRLISATVNRDVRAWDATPRVDEEQ
jgi:eukaryotic-like serine/threonine-protein kinase